MSNPGHRQSDVVKAFLRVSRKYFELGHDRQDFSGLKRRFERALLQSLLVAGGLGGMLGGVAHADLLADESLEARAERGATTSSRPTRSAGER